MFPRSLGVEELERQEEAERKEAERRAPEAKRQELQGKHFLNCYTSYLWIIKSHAHFLNSKHHHQIKCTNKTF